MQGKTRQNIDISTQKSGKQRPNKLSQHPASKTGLLAVLLIVVCAAVVVAHWPALSARALSFDDEQYLTRNVLVRNPSFRSARRFLTEVLKPSTVGGYYQPLTMLSLMADYALAGRADNLRTFHRTSLALHVANTALVVVLLYMLFGQLWAAAAVGLLFGVHPMTVEPIPWVGERKTLLAAFFALWCLILYVRFTRKSNWRLYTGCLVMYVLALMSKPTSTPLPLLMLIMDYWPLRRWKLKVIVREKLPLFIVGAIFAVITYISQSRAAGAVLPSEYGPHRIPLILCHNIIFYLYKIAWPANLSSHYAFPEPLALSQPMVLAGVIGTTVLLAALVISLRWTPAVLTGWLFFFVAILPTMQIIGFSNVIASDKFAYLPVVGLLMVLASFSNWLCSSVSKPMARRVALLVVVIVLAGTEAVATRRYLAYWRDTVTLYEHMLTLTPDSAQLHNHLGLGFRLEGKLDEAINHYHRALQLEPRFGETHNNLGFALATQAKYNDAISHYRQAMKLKPGYAEAHNNLGVALSAQGKFDEAISHYHQALQLKPDFAAAHNNLANALLAQGNIDEADSHYRQALQVNPSFAEAHYNLANILKSRRRLHEAIGHYRKALKISPNNAKAHYHLALTLVMAGQLDGTLEHFREAVHLEPDNWKSLNGLARILAVHPDPKLRDAKQAITFAKRAVELTMHQEIIPLNTLATAYASAGQLDKAITTAQKTLELASEAKDDDLADQIREQLETYRQAK